MMDYAVLLDSKTKRRLLMDKFEDQKNLIQYFIDEHEAEEVVPDMEDLVMMMTDFLETHFIDKLKPVEEEGDLEGESITVEAN